MKSRPDATIVQRFARSDEYPYVAELHFADGARKQIHRFGDNDQRKMFIEGVRALARGLDLRVDDQIEVPRARKGATP